MLRAAVKHVRHCAARRHGIDRNLLVAGVLGEDADEGVNGALGAGVERVPGHAKVPGRVGGHEDDASAVVEMAVCLAGDEELAAGVEGEDAVKLFLKVA